MLKCKKERKIGEDTPMKKHPYNTPKAELLLLAAEDILLPSEEEGDGSELLPPFWQGGDIVLPDIPLG